MMVVVVVSRGKIEGKEHDMARGVLGVRDGSVTYPGSKRFGLRCFVYILYSYFNTGILMF